MELARDRLAVSQTCEAVAETLRGEIEYNSEAGLPYRELIFKAVPDVVLFNSYLKSSLEGLDGVLSVFNIKNLTREGVLSYSANINTIYGETNING